MNRGLIVVAGAGVLVALIAILLLAQEMDEKQALAQENNQLKNEVSEAKRISTVKPILSKPIMGFGRDLSTNKA